MCEMKTNIWQILFFLALFLYAWHIYILSFADDKSHHYEVSEVKMKSAIKDSPLITYTNIEGSIHGRQYVILNNTLDPSMMSILLKRLKDAKKQLPMAQIEVDYGEKRANSLRLIHIPHTGLSFIATLVHYCCNNVDDIVINPKAKYDVQPWRLDPSCRTCLHQPISSNGDYWSYFPFLEHHDVGRAVVLLREPLARLASQIVEMRSLRGMMISLGITKADTEVFTKVVTNKFNETYEDFRDYLETQSDISRGVLQMNTQHKALFKQLLDLAETCYDFIYRKKDRNLAIIEKCRWRMAATFPGMRGCQTRMVLGYNCIDSYQLTKIDLEKAKKRLKYEFAFVGKG
jgi:hypothetical protein